MGMEKAEGNMNTSSLIPLREPADPLPNVGFLLFEKKPSRIILKRSPRIFRQ